MSLKDINLMSSYETEKDKKHLLDSFYIPVLEQATQYYRIAGFFSSTALSIASKGIEGLIHNNGKMRLLVSPQLTEQDYITIREHGKLSGEMEMFSDFAVEQDIDENIQALAWLLDAGRLEIKIVVPVVDREKLFHQKVGIVYDSYGNIISFSGSINETASAWLGNIEEFKVFRSWEPGQIEYLNSDLNKFVDYWNNNKTEIAKVYDIPEAVKENIVRLKPRDVYDLNLMRRYKKDKNIEKEELSLFPHQKEAVQAWKNNDYMLLMEMATGTGKTRTAIGCVVDKMKDKETLLIIVATPQNTLSRQWQQEFLDLNIAIDEHQIIDGSNREWRKCLELLLLDLSEKRYRTAVIFTTHDLCSSKKFTEIVERTKYDTKVVFICDEVHAIGSKQQRNALLNVYEYRIGLSATPERLFDDEGTSVIKNYFGNAAYEFTIRDALHTINPRTKRPFLNKYEYKPIFIELTPSELKKYNNISRQIAILRSKEEYDEEELQRLYDRRAKVCKNAENKYVAFENLLWDLGPENLKDAICFVSDVQIEKVFEILSNARIKRAKITENESASKVVNTKGETERQEIISQFKRHSIQMLVGIKCLDEGIDIVNARIAILMSNSTNPREYIQRIGRVIRQAENKEISIIYDLICTSRRSGRDPIVEREARRSAFIASNAENEEEVKQKFRRFEVDLDAYK